MGDKAWIKRRARAIWRSAMGKPAKQIAVGVEIKSCDDCERTACKDCPTTKAYQRLLETRSCINCGNAGKCGSMPKCGETIRINCISWAEKESTAAETEG